MLLSKFVENVGSIEASIVTELYGNDLKSLRHANQINSCSLPAIVPRKVITQKLTSSSISIAPSTFTHNNHLNRPYTFTQQSSQPPLHFHTTIISITPSNLTHTNHLSHPHLHTTIISIAPPPSHNNHLNHPSIFTQQSSQSPLHLHTTIISIAPPPSHNNLPQSPPTLHTTIISIAPPPSHK